MGLRPSELAHIDCEFCAYCFDEALVMRSNLRERREVEKAKEEADSEARQAENESKLDRALKSVPGV